MVIGYDPNSVQLSKFEIGLASFSTGCLSRCLIQPFDVLKIRFQVQHEPISNVSASSKYQSISSALKTIYREEGIKSFWKGHLTGQLLSTSYIFIQFSSIELLTRYMYKVLPQSFENNKNNALKDFLCGGFAASFAILCIQPLDVLRTRFVAQGEPKIYLNIPHAIECLYKNEGIKGFYRGLLPSLLLITPQTATTFSVYGVLDKYWKGYNKGHKFLGLQSSINGFIAGIIAKSIVYPFDVAKKRLQIQGFEQARLKFGKTVKYDGLFDCFKKTIKQEGLFGLYKGYAPSMLKAGSSTAIVFFFYEEITNFFRILKARKGD